MKRRLQPFSVGRGSSSYILAKKGLLPCMAEKFRTHGWSLLPKHSVPFSSMGNTLKFVDDEEKRGSPLKPISISSSNKNLHILPFFKAQNISSKQLGLLPSIAETFRTHDWPLLLKYTVPLSSMGNTPDFVDDEEISGWRHPKPTSFTDKNLPLLSFLEEGQFSSMLKTELPSMAEAFKTKDWSLLRKFNSMDSKLNIEDALKYELAAMCVWFLFTEVPPHVKEGAARTLAFISLGTAKVTKISIDQTGVENLLVRILSSGNTLAQRQVCLALSVLADYRYRRTTLTLSAGFAGILDILSQYICNLNCNPDLTYPVLKAVARVSLVGKGMRMKIVETELLHSWLVKLLSRKDDESIMEDACWMVSYIAHGQCDCELWDHVKEKLLPPIVNGLCYTTSNVFLLEVVARTILKITRYGSYDQINDVVEMGGLKFLLFATSIKNEDHVGVCVTAIENILKAAKAKSYAENKYAKMIHGYRKGMGWDMISHIMADYDMTGCRADELLHKYLRV